MQNELKPAVVLIIILLLNSCSVLKRSRTEVINNNEKSVDYKEIIQTVKENNIGGQGIFVKKGRVTIEGKELKGSFGIIAGIRDNGDMYASVKGPLGIEIVRFYIKDNEITAIDRMNKIVYYGKKNELIEENLIPYNLKDIILGNYIKEKGEIYEIDYNGQIIINQQNNGLRKEIVLCSDIRKVCKEKVIDEKNGNEITIDYSDFRKEQSKEHAARISINERKSGFKVEIRIEELEIGYKKEIEVKIPDSYRRRKI